MSHSETLEESKSPPPRPKLERRGAVANLREYLLGGKANQGPLPSRKEIKAQFKLSKEQAKAKAEYEKLRPECEKRLAKVQALTVEPPQAGTMQKALDDATSNAEQGKYVEALGVLKAAKFSDLEKAANALQKSRQKGAEKAFPETIKAGNALKTLLDDRGKTALPPGRTASFLQEVSDNLALLLQESADKGTEKDVAEVFGLLKADIATESDKCKLARDIAKTNLGDAKKKLAGLGSKFASEQMAELQQRLGGAETLAADGEWVAAKEAVGALLVDLAKAEKAPGEKDTQTQSLLSEWVKKRQELPGLRKRCTDQQERAKELLQNPATKTLYTQNDAKQIDITGLWIKTLEEVADAPDLRGLSALLERISHVKERLDGSEQRQNAVGSQDFQGAVKGAAPVVVKAKKRVDDALNTLRTAIKDLDDKLDPETILKPYADERDMLQSQFLSALSKAKSVGDVNQEQAAGGLDALADRIDALAGDGMSLAALLTGEQKGVAREACTKAQEAARKALDQLILVDANAAEAWIGTLRQLEAESRQATDLEVINGFTRQFTKLKDELDKERGGKQGDITQKQQELQEALKTAAPLVDEFTKKVEQKRKVLFIEGSSREKEFGELRDYFQATLTEQQAAADVASVSLLTQAVDAAQRLILDVRDALTDLDGGKPEGSGGTTLASHLEILGDMKKALGEGKPAKFYAESAPQLVEQLEGLEKTIKGMPLNDGRTAIQKLVTPATS